MNEIANYCEKVGADVDKVRVGMGTDSRIGKRFLFPGIGYGGSCFPKDVKALQKAGKDSAYDFKILESVIRINDSQKQSWFQRYRGILITIYPIKRLLSGVSPLNLKLTIFEKLPLSL